MTKKIFRSFLAVVISVLLLCLIMMSVVMYDRFSKMNEDQFDYDLLMLAQGMEETGAEYLLNLDGEHYRITWIADDGTILYDNQADPDTMDNHLEREEIREALELGIGESSRYSETLTEKTVYCARRLSDGTVLRISTRQDSFFFLFISSLLPMVLILLPATVISILVARRMSKSIVKPLNELDLDEPSQNSSYEELTPILTKLSFQHAQISNQMKLLKRRADELEQITASMNEGLILLDKHGCIFSINPAAKKLFQRDGELVGKELLSLDSSPEMNNAVCAAFEGGSKEFYRESNGRVYRITVNRTESEGKIIGAVVLCFDITDAFNAEKTRREFTANVSHELKTPLQSIIGSAELLENGLVQPEDTPRFVGHIKNEATRLVSLINDIIRLSQLDENSGAALESVDILEVAGEAAQDLLASAEKKKVSLKLEGEPCVISGVRRYIYEIIYNLCDNAIRYNKENGQVIISVERLDDHAVLKVTDTGIGIEQEHLPRIFERFYRVDKSHSKKTGGTGLGLSIVKHAVAFHGGKTEIESAVDVGTTVTVTL